MDNHMGAGETHTVNQMRYPLCSPFGQQNYGFFQILTQKTMILTKIVMKNIKLKKKMNFD